MEELISDITKQRGYTAPPAPKTKSFIPVKKKLNGDLRRTQIIQSLSAASHNEMLSFHGILLPQRRTLEWKDRTSEAPPSRSLEQKTNTCADTHTDSHTVSQRHTHTQHKRFSSTYQSCSAFCSTCYMQTQSQQGNIQQFSATTHRLYISRWQLLEIADSYRSR